MEKSFGLDELTRRVLEPGLCAACGACPDGCPYLTVFRGKTVVLDKCTVHHGRCFSYCPMSFFEPDGASRLAFGQNADTGPLGHVKEVFASSAANAEVAVAGQGGGTVTALLATALANESIDAAIVTVADEGELFPRGIVATSESEIRAANGSKFVGAHSLTALREALDQGYQKIGVVGLPCQVRAVRKMAVNDLKKEGLKDRIGLVIGLFCNWAFSVREFEDFLSARFNLTHIKRFDIPPPPANSLEVETDEGLSSVSLEELRPLIQAACHVCPDMTSEFADVSVGMFEGRPGWNTLLTRSDKGGDLVRQALEDKKLNTESYPEEMLNQLQAASLRKRERSKGR